MVAFRPTVPPAHSTVQNFIVEVRFRRTSGSANASVQGVGPRDLIQRGGQPGCMPSHGDGALWGTGRVLRTSFRYIPLRYSEPSAPPNYERRWRVGPR